MKSLVFSPEPKISRGWFCSALLTKMLIARSGLILGPIFERYLMRALRISQGDVSVLFSSAIGNILWIMLVLSLLLPYLRQRRMRKTQAKGGSKEG